MVTGLGGRMKVREAEDRVGTGPSAPTAQQEAEEPAGRSRCMNCLSGIHKAFWVKFLEARRQPER